MKNIDFLNPQLFISVMYFIKFVYILIETNDYWKYSAPIFFPPIKTISVIKCFTRPVIFVIPQRKKVFF
jgi:hypothetical protein